MQEEAVNTSCVSLTMQASLILSGATANFGPSLIGGKLEMEVSIFTPTILTLSLNISHAKFLNILFVKFSLAQFCVRM